MRLPDPGRARLGRPRCGAVPARIPIPEPDRTPRPPRLAHPRRRHTPPPAATAYQEYAPETPGWPGAPAPPAVMIAESGGKVVNRPGPHRQQQQQPVAAQPALAFGALEEDLAAHLLDVTWVRLVTTVVLLSVLTQAGRRSDQHPAGSQQARPPAPRRDRQNHPCASPIWLRMPPNRWSWREFPGCRCGRAGSVMSPAR
jgi:hypothetical protein